MRLIAALSLALLTACGADGSPVPPGQSAAPPSAGLSGTAKIGIVGS
jgi:hypothetical protein